MGFELVKIENMHGFSDGHIIIQVFPSGQVPHQFPPQFPPTITPNSPTIKKLIRY